LLSKKTENAININNPNRRRRYKKPVDTLEPECDAAVSIIVYFGINQVKRYA
jgi:hypothetical protein